MAKDIRVDVSGVEPLIAESYQLAPNILGSATLNLDGSSFSLDVEVTNNSDVDFDSAAVMFNTSSYKMGPIPPGETVTTSFKLSGNAGESAVSSFGSPSPISSTYYPGSSPIENGCRVLLDVTECWNSEKQNRYALLRTIDPSYNSGGPGSFSFPRGVVTLFAWSDTAQLAPEVVGHRHEDLATTLYIIELPFKDLIATGSGITVPTSFVTYEKKGSNNVYEEQPEFIYLTNAWVEFEYKPWEQYAEMDVTELSVLIEQQDDFYENTLPPELKIWHWENEKWDDVPLSDWGKVQIENPRDYVGAQTAVRLRIEENSGQQAPIRSVYPSITGDLK